MNSRRKILVIDDEPFTRQLIREILKNDYDLVLCGTGDEAFLELESQRIDLILLDVVMPGESGWEICQALRKNPRSLNVPVLMVTGLNNPEDRVQAFDLGADDYIQKPFMPAELRARVASKMRRATEWVGSYSSTAVVKINDLEVDLINLKASVAEKTLPLGQVEFKILSLLVRTPGELVDRKAIEDFIWGGEPPSDRALDPHMATLRKKLALSSTDLRTVYGRGFAIMARSL